MAPGGDIAGHTMRPPSPDPHGLPRPAVDPVAHAALDQALHRGDRARAIRLIDEVFGAGLFRFIQVLVRRADLADDLYQITLLEAFRDLGTFEARSTLRTWLFGIARHRCLDALKTGRRRDAALVPAEDLPDHPDSAPGPGQRLEDVQLKAALGACLDQLTAETRMILVMRFAEGMPYDDIARICEASTEAVRARVSRALPALRRCIEHKGVP